MRLFRQPRATDDHWRMIGGDKHRTVSRIRGCRRHGRLSSDLVAHPHEGLDLRVIKGNIQGYTLSNRTHLCLEGRVLGTQTVDELAHDSEDLLVILANDRTRID